MIGDEEDYYMSRQWDDDREAYERAALKGKLRAVAGKNPSRGGAGRAPVTSVAKVESDRSRKNSRVKGSRAELDVAEMFSRWCGEIVRRTPGSGGWSNAKFGVTADLVCANKKFPFHVEVKHREGWVLDDLVTGVRREHDKSIVQWWKQCVESCPKTRFSGSADVVLDKEPLLVFRRNRQPWLVMFRVLADVLIEPDVSGARFNLTLEITAASVGVVVMRLDAFLDTQPVPKGLRNHKRCKS